MSLAQQGKVRDKDGNKAQVHGQQNRLQPQETAGAVPWAAGAETRRGGTQARGGGKAKFRLKPNSAKDNLGPKD